jgi:hypothetical protein
MRAPGDRIGPDRSLHEAVDAAERCPVELVHRVRQQRDALGGTCCWTTPTRTRLATRAGAGSCCRRYSWLAGCSSPSDAPDWTSVCQAVIRPVPPLPASRPRRSAERYDSRVLGAPHAIQAALWMPGSCSSWSRPRAGASCRWPTSR